MSDNEPIDIVVLLAEQRIREAIENWEFDDLPGKGKPLNLEDLEGVPSDLRAAYHLLKQNGLVPPEVEVSKEIGRLEEELARTADPDDRAALQKQITLKRISADIMLQRWQRQRKSGR